MGQGQPVDAGRVAAALSGRSVVLVGMMGAGKTSVGKRLAARLGLPFVDADAEIEAGAQLTISEIFERFGELYFREGERKVIARLLNGGPLVLATGGGAFMNATTRQNIARHGVSIWLKPSFEVLLARVRKKSNRPLLKTADPEQTLRRLLEERTPTYALADFTIESLDGSHDTVVEAILRRLDAALAKDVEPAEEARRRVEVPLGARAYSILIGPGVLDQAGTEIARIAPGVHCAIVTDARVAPLYLDRLRASLDQAGLRSTAIVCPPGEATKSYAEFARVCDALIEARVERRDIVIALGGGVIGDLAGFCAASLRRGVRLVQVPTTLLAQVDSSVGGKTGINSRHGKNLVGAFHQPSLVLADTLCLDSLSERDFRSGYAEVVKYGLIRDRGFFEFLESNWRDAFAGGPARAEAIAVSCAAKARVVVADETEQGERALLNLGHTFGHALESSDRVRFGAACPWRRRRDRHDLRFPVVARPWPVLRTGRDAGREPSEGGRPSDPDARHPRLRRCRRRYPGRHAAGQESRPRPADLHSRQGDRGELRRPRRRRGERLGFPGPRDGRRGLNVGLACITRASARAKTDPWRIASTSSSSR